MKTMDIKNNDFSMLTVEQFHKLAVHVILRALDDYKDDPSKRPEIERWIKKGDFWLDEVLPNFTPSDIIRRFRSYAGIET